MMPAEKHSEAHRLFHKELLVVLLVALFLGGAVYIAQMNIAQTGQRRIQALEQANSAAAFLSADQIAMLDGNESDLNKDSYRQLKESLIRLKASNAEVVFAYLYAARSGGVSFLADSEMPGSEGYSPPGQAYAEASEADWNVLRSGLPAITEPVSDRWGKWVSALVPIKDQAGQVVAVLGMDYEAGQWLATDAWHIVTGVSLVVLAFFLLVLVYWMYKKSREREALLHMLNDSETLFRAVFAQSPFGIAIIRGGTVSSMNPMFSKIMGRTEDELKHIGWADITHPEDVMEELELYRRFMSGETDGYTLEKRYIRPDGSSIWAQMILARLFMSDSPVNAHLCILHDIQERKQTQEALNESERSKSVLLAHLPGLAYRCQNDQEWTMLFISDGCLALTGYRAENLLNNNTLSFNDLICPEYRDTVRKEWDRVLALRQPFRYEYEIITASGEHKWVLEMGQGVYNTQCGLEALEGIIIDITESKRQSAQIRHLNDHDFLTGLYSRKYFEESKHQLDAQANLPLSIIIADINGIRILNNAFGYEQADQVIAQIAKVLEQCARSGDILARTGGDEFGLLLPKTDQEESYRLIRQMKKACEGTDFSSLGRSVHISLSLGCGTKTDIGESIDAIEREAEENLHKNKILEQASYHNAMLASFMATMNARSQETEEHAQRLVALSCMMGSRLALSQKSLDDLQLFSILHDIGKIGIDDRILNKPGKLSEEEWSVMKKHPEIGYGIVVSLPELSSVAEYILTHHERWDGTGYPKGLKGEEIPLLSRILAVADAYDAMTEERIYRKKRSKAEAMEEIKNNAGTQFDPAVVAVFIECMQ